MSFQTFILIMAMVVVFMAWQANSSKRNKIHCSFTRVNKTEINKFVKMVSRYVVFDGKRYDIVPSCIKFTWWDKGLVHMLFPQWVAALDFTYASRWPIDPATGKSVIISPEVRSAMNKEEWVKSYAKGFTPPSTKKQTAIQQYLPYIAILLIVMMGVYFYTNMQALGASLADIANRVNAIAR